MATLKQLSSFMVLNVDGGDRVSFTYNEINSETGELISQNNKRNFIALDPSFVEEINKIREYIRTNKLS